MFTPTIFVVCGQPTKLGGIQSLGCMLLFGGVFMIVLVVIALVAC